MFCLPVKEIGFYLYPGLSSISAENMEETASPAILRSKMGRSGKLAGEIPPKCQVMSFSKGLAIEHTFNAIRSAAALRSACLLQRSMLKRRSEVERYKKTAPRPKGAAFCSYQDLIERCLRNMYSIPAPPRFAQPNFHQFSMNWKTGMFLEVMFGGPSYSHHDTYFPLAQQTGAAGEVQHE